MARTLRDKLDGIISFRTFRHISNARGFNNKIRWRIKQAYGLRDREYFMFVEDLSIPGNFERESDVTYGKDRRREKIPRRYLPGEVSHPSRAKWDGREPQSCFIMSAEPCTRTTPECK